MYTPDTKPDQINATRAKIIARIRTARLSRCWGVPEDCPGPGVLDDSTAVDVCVCSTLTTERELTAFDGSGGAEEVSRKTTGSDWFVDFGSVSTEDGSSVDDGTPAGGPFIVTDSISEVCVQNGSPDGAEAVEAGPATIPHTSTDGAEAVEDEPATIPHTSIDGTGAAAAPLAGPEDWDMLGHSTTYPVVACVASPGLTMVLVPPLADSEGPRMLSGSN